MADKKRPPSPAEVERAFQAGIIPSRVKRMFCGGDSTTIRPVKACANCGRPHRHNNTCCSSICFKDYKGRGMKGVPPEERVDWENIKPYLCKECGANYEDPAYDEPFDDDPSRMKCPECGEGHDDGGVVHISHLTTEEIQAATEKEQDCVE